MGWLAEGAGWLAPAPAPLPSTAPDRPPACLDTAVPPPPPLPPLRRSATHLSTWAGKGSDPGKSFADLQAAKAAADDARADVARRFTQARAVGALWSSLLEPQYSCGG